MTGLSFGTQKSGCNNGVVVGGTTVSDLIAQFLRFLVFGEQFIKESAF